LFIRLRARKKAGQKLMAPDERLFALNAIAIACPSIVLACLLHPHPRWVFPAVALATLTAAVVLFPALDSNDTLRTQAWPRSALWLAPLALLAATPSGYLLGRAHAD